MRNGEDFSYVNQMKSASASILVLCLLFLSLFLTSAVIVQHYKNLYLVREGAYSYSSNHPLQIEHKGGSFLIERYSSLFFNLFV